MKLKRCIAIFLIVSMASCFTVFADEKSSTVTTTDKVQSGQEEVIQWIAATSSILNEQNQQDHRLIELPRNDLRAKECKDILKQSWSIVDTNDLRSQVKSLIGGGHNEDFRLFYTVVNTSSKDEAASALAQLGSDVVNRIPIIKSTGDKWGDKGIVAWDLFRVGNLVSWGYAAGYIELDEACLLMEPAVSLLKKNFSSWDDAVANYLDGYCYWANVDPTKDGTTYTERKNIYTNLKKSRSDLFNDSLFSSPPVVGLKKTVAPTPELLNGYWSCEYKEDPYKGTLVQYYFDKDGNASCYIEFLGVPIYSRGFYSIENGVLSITYNYIDDGENQISLTGAAMKKEVDTYCFSPDGSNLITIDADLGHTRLYTKNDGKKFAKYQNF